MRGCAFALGISQRNKRYRPVEITRRSLRSNRFCDGSDLITLEQHRIARFFVVCLLDVFCVCDQQIIPNQFKFAFFVELGPTVPVILVGRSVRLCGGREYRAVFLGQYKCNLGC